VDGTAIEVLVERGRMLAGNLASSIDVAERPLDCSQELLKIAFNGSIVAHSTGPTCAVS